MTIGSETRKAGPFDGNDSTTDFAFAFKVFAESDLQVVTATAGVETVQALTTNYTVSLNADQNTSPGGTVTMLSAPATGSTLTITSDVPNTQPVNLVNLGGFYPTVINDALDRATIQIQQLEDANDRSIKIPLSSEGTVSTSLPLPVSNKYLRWNTDGTGIVNADISALDPSGYFLTDAGAPNGIVTGSAGSLFLSTDGAGYIKTSGAGNTGWEQLITYNPVTGETSTTYNQGSTGAVTRTFDDKLQDYVSFKDFGAKGDGVTDDSVSIQAALNSGVAVITGSPGDVYLCGTALDVPSGIKIIGNGSEFKRNFLGGFLLKNSTSNSTWNNTDIELIDIYCTDNGNAARGGFVQMVGVDRLRISGLKVISSAVQDGVTNGWACYVSGKDIRITDIFINTSAATLYGDGVHLAYVEDFTMSNFVINAGDDAIALHYPPAPWTNSGKNLASKNVSISNGVVSSVMANGIRIGASSPSSGGGNAGNNCVWKQVRIDNVIVEKTGALGRCLTLFDDRDPANIADQHDNIILSNITNLGSTTEGLVRIKGNPDTTSNVNLAQRNFGKVEFNDVLFTHDTSTGQLFLGGGAEKVIFRGGFWRQTAASTTTCMTFEQIDNLIFSDVGVETNTTGTGINLKWCLNTNFYDFSFKGNTTEFQAVLLTTNTDQSSSFRMYGGQITDALRGVFASGSGVIDDFIIAGSDFHNLPTNPVGTITATRKNVVFAEKMVASDGTTGGSGSAGAGNQYVELEVGGLTYKVLHDGTV